MTAYFVARLKVKDADALAEYSKQAGPILASFGGKLLFKGGADNIFLGETDYKNIAVFEFANRKAVNDFYQSDAYQALVPIRSQGADMLFSVHEPA